MKIGEYPVVISKDEIKVGCTTVTRDQIMAILAKMDKPAEFCLEGPKDNITRLVEQARDYNLVDHYFMQKRAHGEYENKGFYLSDADHQQWKIVVDEYGCQILIPDVPVVPTEDEIPF